MSNYGLIKYHGYNLHLRQNIFNLILIVERAKQSFGSVNFKLRIDDIIMSYNKWHVSNV